MPVRVSIIATALHRVQSCRPRDIGLFYWYAHPHIRCPCEPLRSVNEREVVLTVLLSASLLESPTLSLLQPPLLSIFLKVIDRQSFRQSVLVDIK